MTIDFKARTRAQLQGLPDEPTKPGESLPYADEECLRELGATENWPRTCEYWHPKHSLSDFMRPGYFTGDLRARMHPGDVIHHCLYGGSRDPCDWARGVCVVIEVPSHSEQPLILAGLIEYPSPTPWRGDDDKSKAA
jgi:hypothetical protein